MPSPKTKRLHISPRVSDTDIATWQETLSGETPRGLFDSAEIIGYFFNRPAHLDQFARRSLSRVATSWCDSTGSRCGALTKIETRPQRSFVTMAFASAGPNVFRHGDDSTWRAALVQITDDELPRQRHPDRL